MPVVLEIKSGPMAGKSLSLRNGESVTIGRAAAKSQLALPQDTFMSGLHFAVECGPQGARVIDRKSSNGTFLNGRKLREFEATPLATGDEIKAGQTIFIVKMIADEKLGATSPAKPAGAPFDQGQPHASSPRQPSYGPPQSAERRPQPPPAQPVSPPPAEEPVGGASGFFSGPSNPQAPPQADRLRGQLDADRVRASARPEPRAEEPPRAPDRARPLDAQDALGRSPGPHLEEPPQVHAIPGLPQPEKPRPAREPVVDGGRRAGADSRRGVEPSREAPPPVAPKPWDDFAQRPAERRPARPRDSAFRVKGWSFPAAPAEWQVQEGFGFQRAAQEELPSSVAVTEELLGGITLQQFVESQISTLRNYLRQAQIEPIMPPRVNGADETMAVDARYLTKEGKQLIQRWIYARSGSCVGMLTVKTLASELPQVLQSLQPLLDAAAFQATVQV